MKFTNKNILYVPLTFIFSVLVGVGGAIAFEVWHGSEIEGYRVPFDTSIQIADLSYDMGDYGLGYQLTNTSGKNHFIPTRSQNE